MDQILLFGLNHKTAPVSVREKIAFTDQEISEALNQLKESDSISEIAITSTCNRVEFIVATSDFGDCIKNIKELINLKTQINFSEIDNFSYCYENDKAVSHLFEVAASLDSMVLGEPQILGQVKQAYKKSVTSKTSGVILNRLMHKTFFVAKRIRNETGIGGKAVSISYMAVELGKKIFGSLDKKKALLLGAGEMAEIAIEHLITNKIEKIFIANRTFEKGVQLAQKFNGAAIKFDELNQILQEADIVISSTAATKYILTKQDMKPVMKFRKNKPIFFVDIAVPRDLDPEINDIDNCYLYDIDDLKGIINKNIENRNSEAVKAKRIIDESVILFMQWYKNLEVVPTIISLRKKMEKIADFELKKTVQSQKTIDDDAYIALKKMTNSMINKFLHDPTYFLKNTSMHQKESYYLDITRKLFNLD